MSEQTHRTGDVLPIEIKAGAVRVSHAYVHMAAESILLVYIDMHSKRADLIGTFTAGDSTPGVMLGADEHTLHLDETKDREALTDVGFPTLKGWRIFCASAARYTVSVTLYKEDA